MSLLFFITGFVWKFPAEDVYQRFFFLKHISHIGIVIDTDGFMPAHQNIFMHGLAVPADGIAFSKVTTSGVKFPTANIVIGHDILVYIIQAAEPIHAGIMEQLRFQIPDRLKGGFQHG